MPYETNPDDPDAPVYLEVYKGIRAGDRVKYVGPMPLEGTFIVNDIVQFATNDVLVEMRDVDEPSDIYEVNADNLEKT